MLEPDGDVEGDGSGVVELVAVGVSAAVLLTCVGVGDGDAVLGVLIGVGVGAAVGVRPEVGAELGAELGAEVGVGEGLVVAPDGAEDPPWGLGDTDLATGAATSPTETPVARAGAWLGRCGRMPWPGEGVADCDGQVAPTGCWAGTGRGPTNRPATYAPTGTVTNTATAISAFPRIDMEPCFPVLGE